MKDLGREEQGIRLPDGNYFGALMVFHHLHCLVCPFADELDWELDRWV
jgi:hypothetical protein